MATLTAALPFEGAGRISAKAVSAFIHEVLRLTGVPEKHLAQGIGIAESQLNRMASLKSGTVKAVTVQPLRRVAVLLEEASQALSEKGVRHWLATPNAYLNDVPPILCLRSDRELDRVLAVLASIRYGFPA